MNEYGFRYTADYLQHHGIKDQKWYHRRFQNKDGSLTPEGRERYGVGKSRKEIEKEKAKEKAKEEKKAKKEAKIEAKKEKKQEAKEIKKYGKKIPDYSKMTEEEIKKYKDRALASGNVKEISKNIGHYSKTELDNAYNLIQSRKKITDLTKENIKTGEQKLKEWASKITSIEEITRKGIALTNEMASISNTYLSTNIKPIGMNYKDPNKKK